MKKLKRGKKLQDRVTFPDILTDLPIDAAQEEERQKLSEQLSRVYCRKKGETGYSYFLVMENMIRPYAEKEFNLLIQQLSSNEKGRADKIEKLKLLNEVHETRVISNLEYRIIPTGQREIKICQKANGEFGVTVFIPFGNVLADLVEEHKAVNIPDKFEPWLRRHYSTVIEIYEAALARKLIQHKKSYVWFHAISDYGKTFFFHVPGLTKMFNKQYTQNDFKGDPPDVFASYLLFFIDEADRFTSEMKNDVLQYRQNYGGSTEITMPMRILASANVIPDLSEGVDQQLLNRVVKIQPASLKLEDSIKELGLHFNEAKLIFTAWIIRHLHKTFNDWLSICTFGGEQIENWAEEKYVEFLKAHGDSMKGSETMDQYIIQTMADMLLPCIRQENSTGTDKKGKLSFVISTNQYKKELANYCHVQDYDPASGHLSFVLTEPAQAKAIIADQLGDRKFAFQKSFPGNKEFGRLSHHGFNHYRVNNKQIRGIKFDAQFQVDNMGTQSLTIFQDKCNDNIIDVVDLL